MSKYSQFIKISENEEIINEYIDSVDTKKLTLGVVTTETYWPGHGSGKMEDMPGRFMRNNIFVGDYREGANHLEILAAEIGVILFEEKREITNEPKEYSKLCHRDFLKEVKKDPSYYLQNLRRAVKEAL